MMQDYVKLENDINHMMEINTPFGNYMSITFMGDGNIENLNINTIMNLIQNV